MQSDRERRALSQPVVFLFMFMLLLPWNRAMAAIPTINGSFIQFVDDFQFVAKKSEAYQQPTSRERKIFRLALTSLLKGKVAKAQRRLSPIKMEVVRFNDTASGILFYLIREKLNVTSRGWGLYALNPNSLRNIVLEIPHPVSDAHTESEGASFFLELEARALIIAGAHRCANTASSPCSGTTSVCSDSDSEEPHRISDAAHFARQLFHVAHKTLLKSDSASVAVALHGFSQGGSDPHAFVSDGTNAMAPAENLANLLTEGLIAETGLVDAAQSCNDGSAGARLCGTEDIQGRYANGSPKACLLDAPTSTGRFLHIEQSLDFRTAGGDVESAHLLAVLADLF